ncbi:MAG: hypothetical protein ACP5SH_27170 [Syntrophobacteraceae bacterium]
MQWIINNVKMLIALFLLSLMLNMGMSAWLIKLNRRIGQMNHRIEILTNIAVHKEKEHEKTQAAERKFFNAPLLPLGKGKGY